MLLEVAKTMPDQNEEVKKLFDSNQIEVAVDLEMIKAQSAKLIPSIIEILVKSKWKVLIDESNQFLTSDNPVCLYYPENNNNIAWWYAPLSKDMALIIMPYSSGDGSISKPEYGKIISKYRDEFNLNLIRNAEKTVLFDSKQKWVESLVHKNRKWRSESINGAIGDLIFTLDRVCETK
jgi:hypothetical protein